LGCVAHVGLIGHPIILLAGLSKRRIYRSAASTHIKARRSPTAQKGLCHPVIGTPLGGANGEDHASGAYDRPSPSRERAKKLTAHLP
jgi:hypothetical protein